MTYNYYRFRILDPSNPCGFIEIGRIVAGLSFTFENDEDISDEISVQPEDLAYKTKTYSSGTHGRAICNARDHHFVADDSGGEEVGAGELFLAGIGACAVNLVERLAKAEGIPINRMEVAVGAYRDPQKAPGELSVFDKVEVHFDVWGVKEEQAEYLVGLWKRR